MIGSDRLPIEDIKARTSIAAIVERCGVKLKRSGREHSGLCPFHNERTASFTVREDKGFHHCFGCGAHGDVIAFLMQMEQMDFIEAAKRLGYEAGLIDNPGNAREIKPAIPRLSPEEVEAENKESEREALAIWKAAQSVAGTLAEKYLRQRAINISLPASLRYSAALKHSNTGLLFPAMIGAVQAPDRSIRGVHRTYLTADGRGKGGVAKPKKMKGTCWGGALRLTAAAESLIVCEGIETALSLLQSIPGAAVWAALSLDNLAGCHTAWIQHPSRPDKKMPNGEPEMSRPGIILPDIVREVVIATDADNGDPEGAESRYQCAARRFIADGRKVRIMRPPAGHDFNSVLQAATVAERATA